MKCVKVEFLSLAPLPEGLLLLVKLLSGAIALVLVKTPSRSPFLVLVAQAQSSVTLLDGQKKKNMLNTWSMASCVQGHSSQPTESWQLIDYYFQRKEIIAICPGRKSKGELDVMQHGEFSFCLLKVSHHSFPLWTCGLSKHALLLLGWELVITRMTWWPGLRAVSK